ncbi:MAG: cytochrome c biogenesis protein DipZ [Actinobacteria bacterium]|nr:cytochrome c biogenesis protein DipZ [Actinomycetota bacterium]
MLTLVLIGLLSGIVTGLSPCILPVLPAVLATSAIPPGLADPTTGTQPKPDRKRPFIVIAGLVTSFAVFTLIGASLLAALGLPADLLRNIGIAAMILVGIGFLIPAVGHLLERPFARFSRVGPRRSGSAFLFGATFGLAFVPCAGPVLATITVLAATNQVQSGLIVLTIAFSIGVALPLLAFALAGQQMATRITAVRTRMPLVRRITGAVLIVTALAVFFGLADQVQRLVPSYVTAAQSQIEDSTAAREALGTLNGPAAAGPEPGTVPVDSPGLGPVMSFDKCEKDPSTLANCGTARDFVGIQAWLNTPGGKALTLEALRGRVVLVDFWTYSCINCQRTLPYLTAWDAKYRDKGLTIVGVHSPEFAFEHEVGNVADQAARLGVTYPIAIDNDFKTWRAYDQRFWPAHYLIDKNGTVRQVHYGEGSYDQTEALIRQLLDQKAPDAAAIAAEGAPAVTPAMMPGTTPETYLGSERANAYANPDLVAGSTHTYEAPGTVPPDGVALDGEWTIGPESITAGNGARLQLRYTANKVFLVLGGEGSIDVTVDGKTARTIDVHGSPTLYTLDKAARHDALLTLTATPGVAAYAFTFG